MKKKYLRLLLRMYVVENLGEDLYRALCSRCKDVALKSVYQALADNESQTRERIEEKLVSLGQGIPRTRAVLISVATRPFMKAIPRRWLHGILIRILRRRMFSGWHQEYKDLDEKFWAQLLEHEELQHRLLNVSECSL